MFSYFIDIRAMSYYEIEVQIVNISNGNSIIMFFDIISSIDTN